MGTRRQLRHVPLLRRHFGLSHSHLSPFRRESQRGPSEHNQARVVVFTDSIMHDLLGGQRLTMAGVEQ